MSGAPGEAPAASDRTVFCRQCRRRAGVPSPGQGHPYGWFCLIVHVPPWLNAGSGKPYRSVGLFCSAACLAAAMPAITTEEELHASAYEHE